MAIIPSFLVFGRTRIDALDMDGALQATIRLIAARKAGYICVANVHTAVTATRDAVLNRVFKNAALVLPDGMPLVWYGGWHGYRMGRVAGPDFMERMIRFSYGKAYRHFLLGSTPETIQTLHRNLEEKAPDLQLCGMISPPFRPFTNRDMHEMADAINAANADIVWVGLGAPKQELWMADMQPLLNRAIMVGVGAAFDFLAGTLQRAPGWMQRAGLEWFYRLLRQPRRLWRRYLINNTIFIAWWVRELACSPRSRS